MVAKIQTFLNIVMHILHTLFTHAQGGLGQAHVNTTEALVSKGHKVTALMHGNSPYCREVAKYGTVHRLQPVGFYDIAAVWKIRQLLKRLRPDIILAHNARAIALMSYAALGLGLPVCGVTHSYKTRRTMRADALVVLSEHMKRHFIEAGYKKPMEVIPNLIHLPPKSVFCKPGTPAVIGALGRFTIEKGFSDLLQALYKLKEAGVEFRAVIGGDGSELPQLKMLAGTLGLTGYIQWKGWVEDKAAFYRELDIICVPSLEESFPLVVIEALAHGVPIVATDTPGPASMLTDGVNGLLVPRGNTQAMANALAQLATQPGMAVRLAEAGWQHVQEYDFPAVAKRWDEVLKNIISATKSYQTA